MNEQAMMYLLSILSTVLVIVLTANAFPQNGDTSTTSSTCMPSGTLTGKKGACNHQNMSSCCKTGVKYPTYTCSPPVTSSTAAELTLNGFGAGQDGGGAAECDGKFHKNSELIAALSTGWYAGGSRCGKQIAITANGKTVLATIVDECDSTAGCDKQHAGQPPCDNDIVDVSSGVWKALGISKSNPNYGMMAVTWADA